MGSSRPEAIRSRVDFPHPEGPTTVTNSPLSTVKLMSVSASVPSGKTIPMPSKDRVLIVVVIATSRYPLCRSSDAPDLAGPTGQL